MTITQVIIKKTFIHVMKNKKNKTFLFYKNKFVKEFFSLSNIKYLVGRHM